MQTWHEREGIRFKLMKKLFSHHILLAKYLPNGCCKHS